MRADFLRDRAARVEAAAGGHRVGLGTSPARMIRREAASGSGSGATESSAFAEG